MSDYITERNEMNESVDDYAADTSDDNKAAARKEIDEYIGSIRTAASAKSTELGVDIDKFTTEVEDQFFSAPIIDQKKRDLVKRSLGLSVKRSGAFIIKVDTRYGYSTTLVESEGTYHTYTPTGNYVNLAFTGDFTVDWGDGQTNKLATHAYAQPGEYEISIVGDVTPTQSERGYIREVVQWGDECKFTSYLFLLYRASALTAVPVDDWPETFDGCSFQGMFYDCRSFNQSLEHWKTEKVVAMDYMFQNCISYNKPMNKWRTDSVTNMFYMFAGAGKFNQALDKWNTASVTNMSYMFFQCTEFNGNIGTWNTGAVTNMSYMFYEAKKFNRNINDWNTAAVTNMAGIFYDADDFNQPLDQWTMDNVLNISNMFQFTKSFNQPIGNWNLSKVTDSGRMFQYAEAFNQPIGNWNLSSCSFMRSMFEGSKAFKQDISTWTIGYIGDYASFARDCLLEPTDLPPVMRQPGYAY